jgi:hypothetical protein
VVHCAPGHHPYSYILFCEKHGILLSADALWEKGFGVIFPALDSWAGKQPQQLLYQISQRMESTNMTQTMTLNPAVILSSRADLADTKAVGGG